MLIEEDLSVSFNLFLFCFNILNTSVCENLLEK